MAFPPSKKPGMSVMLGIAPRGPKEEAPPAYGGAKSAPPDPAADPMEAKEGEGMCSVMCPKCGEAIDLQIMPAPADSGDAGEADQGGAPDMEAAG